MRLQSWAVCVFTIMLMVVAVELVPNPHTFLSRLNQLENRVDYIQRKAYRMSSKARKMVRESQVVKLQELTESVKNISSGNNTPYLSLPENLIRSSIKPPDPSEISIRRIFRKPHISIQTKIIKNILSRNFYKWSGVSNPWSKTTFYWSGEKNVIIRMAEVGRSTVSLRYGEKLSTT